MCCFIATVHISPAAKEKAKARQSPHQMHPSRIWRKRDGLNSSYVEARCEGCENTQQLLLPDSRLSSRIGRPRERRDRKPCNCFQCAKGQHLRCIESQWYFLRDAQNARRGSSFGSC